MLEGVGITAEQEEAYRRLLSQPQLTLAGEASEPVYASLVGASEQVYAGLVGASAPVYASLVEAGLAVRTGPDSFAAISPDVAVAGLVRGRMEAARRAEQAVPELMAAFWQARQADQRDFVDVVTDQDGIIDRWYQLQRTARREVRGFDCPPYFADPLEPDPLELERLGQGVSYRVVYAEEVLRVPGRWRDLEAGIGAGEQARVVPRLPVKLTLFDDFAATLPMAEGHPAARAGQPAGPAVIVVHRSPMLDSLSALFEAYWEQAVPIVFTAAGAPELTPGEDHDAQLIRLLAAGFGNDAIQRALGLSASTVQRRVHQLMERLGAKTRFQAGLMLGRMSRTD